MKKPDLSLPPRPPSPDFVTTRSTKELTFASIWGKAAPEHTYLPDSIVNSNLIFRDEQDNNATHRRAGTWDSPKFIEVFNMSDSWKRSNPGSDVSELAERVARGMHLDIDEQGSSSARGRSQSFPLYSPHSFMNNSSPLPSGRALHDHAEEEPTCETSLPGRLTPGAEYLNTTGNVTLISHKRVISEDSTGWTDPWDRPINPIYDPVTGKLIGAADIPRKVPYWVTDGESSEDSIQRKDNDSWSFMTHSNAHSGSHSDPDTESLDPLGIPKSHHWTGERANPPIHNACGYIPPEIRDEYRARNRKNKLSRNQLNRFYEIIDGNHQKLSNPQIGRDAAIQHENWRKAEAGYEHRIDNRKPLSTRAAHVIEPIDRRAPTTGWHHSSTSRMIPVSQDSRYYARMSSPINSKDYFASDVPTRFVTPSQERFSDSRFVTPSQERFSDSRFATPSQEHISDSRFLPANSAYHHAQRGHTRKYYSSSGRFGGCRSVKPPYNDAMMYHHPSSPRIHQNSTRNPDNYFRGAANPAYHRIERKPLPASNFYRYCPHSANIGSFGNGRDNYHGLDAANNPLPSGRYYRNNYERTSPRTLRRSANYENLRGLPMRTA